MLVGNALHAHESQGVVGDLLVLRGVALVEFAVWRAAHQHHFQNGIVKVRTVFLPHHRHLPGRLAIGKGFDLPAVDEYGVLLRGQGAVDVLEQRGFAAAVGTDEADKLLFVHLQGYFAQNFAGGHAVMEIAYLDFMFHCKPPHILPYLFLR